MPLQLGHTVMQIHLDKALSRRSGAGKHHIYLYAFLYFKLNFSKI
jgi:hypothetical protein